jgi:hypothetical protein
MVTPGARLLNNGSFANSPSQKLMLREARCRYRSRAPGLRDRRVAI